MERTYGKPRKDVIGNAKDHHRDEAEERGVHVRSSVDRPGWMNRDGDAEDDCDAQPDQARFDETSREPVHQKITRRGESVASIAHVRLFIDWLRSGNPATQSRCSV